MSIHKVKEMEGEEGVYKPLPDELVEKIVAMMPYPLMFKGRLLSKAWRARFESISSLRDGEEKRVANTFQRQVREWSKRWDVFCPFSITKEDLFAYNQRSKRWQSIPLKNFFRRFSGLMPVEGTCFSSEKKVKVHIEGALLYGIWETRGHRRLLFVTNILTRTWKELRPPPGDLWWSGIIHCMKLVINPSSEAYKLVLSYQDIRHEDPHFVLVYDSKSETWSSKRFAMRSDWWIFPSSFAYLDGVLYGWSTKDMGCLVTFNMEQGTMEGLNVSFGTSISMLTGKLVVCNGSLMLIMFETDRVVYVRKIDVESRCWRQIAACHVYDFKSDMIDIPSSDGHQEFFTISDECAGVCGGAIVVYNQHSDEWSFVNFPEPNHAWNDYSFQPGLNPFMAV